MSLSPDDGKRTENGETNLAQEIYDITRRCTGAGWEFFMSKLGDSRNI